MTIKRGKKAEAAYQQGAKARREGKDKDANPFLPLGARFETMAAWWTSGWQAANGDIWNDELPF